MSGPTTKTTYAQQASPTQTALLSPRLQALQKDIDSGSAAAVEKFWQEIQKQGTPLIEPTPDKKNFSYVTFLWRGTNDTKNVLVNLFNQNSQMADARFLAQGRMSLLPNSNIWYRTYRLRNDARFSYRLSSNDVMTLLPPLSQDERTKRLATLQADPLNPNHYVSRNGDASIVELPEAPAQPWITPLPGIARGKVEEKSFKSTLLKNERTVWIYTPAGYKTNGTPFHLLVAFDGAVYSGANPSESVPAPTILDNLIAKQKIPPIVAVMIGNADGARLRELNYYEPFNEFLVKELLPWVRKNYNVTSNPKEVAVSGLSLGGNASLFAGFKHSEVFGNVIAQSGGHMFPHTREEFNPPQHPGSIFYEEEMPDNSWLIREIVRHPRLPLKVFLTAGLLEDVEWQQDPPRFAYPSLLLATRHLRDVLQAKDYEVYYDEYNGAHEGLSWRGTFANGLIALFGKGS
jgi:enterochelin esterase family protein